MNRRLLGGALALAITATTAEASAWEPNATAQRAGGDVYWWSAKLFGSSFALVPYLQLRLNENLFFDAKLPIGMNINGPDDKSRFGLGNPMAGVHYAVSTTSLTYYVGARTNLPLTSIFDDSTQQVAGVLGALSMAYYDLHLWEPYYIPVGVFGGVEVPASEAVIIRAELAPQFDIPLKKASPDGKPQFLYQARAEVEARAESGMGGGGGLQLVHLVGRSGDNAQLAAEGFFGYSKENLFARVGLLIALDEPLGFGFDKGKVVSLHAGVGTRF